MATVADGAFSSGQHGADVLGASWKSARLVDNQTQAANKVALPALQQRVDEQTGSQDQANRGVDS
jgi:hypothetical protein